jgi:hypothetical protein
MIKRIWNSPTLNTWASFFGRTLGAVLVLPLVLKKFPVEDFNVWSLFSTLLGLQLLVDMGFCVTFVRAIAFCLAGAESPAAFQRNAAVSKNDGPNWGLLDRVIGSMRFIYRRLALLYLVLLAVVGSAVLARPISLTPDPTSAWLAWAVVVVAGYVNLRTNYLAVLLQGLNEIALVRRWEAITSVATVLTGFVVLLLGGNLLVLVASMQIWSIAAALRNRWLSAGCQSPLRSVTCGKERPRDDGPTMAGYLAQRHWGAHVIRTHPSLRSDQCPVCQRRQFGQLHAVPAHHAVDQQLFHGALLQQIAAAASPPGEGKD